MLTLTIYRDLMSPADVAESHVPIVELLRARRSAAAGREARKHVLISRQARARRTVGSLSTSVEPATRVRASEGSERRASTRGALAALFLAALALRPQIIGVGPLIPSIQHGLGTTHAIAGLLGTIPVLCMGIFAPLAAYLAARVGTRRAMTLALGLIGFVGIARALSPNAWTVVLLTIPVGVGMGIGNAIAPIAVRERIPLSTRARNGRLHDRHPGRVVHVCAARGAARRDPRTAGEVRSRRSRSSPASSRSRGSSSRATIRRTRASRVDCSCRSARRPRGCSCSRSG